MMENKAESQYIWIRLRGARKVRLSTMPRFCLYNEAIVNAAEKVYEIDLYLMEYYLNHSGFSK